MATLQHYLHNKETVCMKVGVTGPFTELEVQLRDVVVKEEGE